MSFPRKEAPCLPLQWASTSSSPTGLDLLAPLDPHPRRPLLSLWCPVSQRRNYGVVVWWGALVAAGPCRGPRRPAGGAARFFAKCATNNTRQTTFCRVFGWRVLLRVFQVGMKMVWMISASDPIWIRIMRIRRSVFNIDADVDNPNPIVCGCRLEYGVYDIRRIWIIW
jgi:hypothetical protein